MKSEFLTPHNKKLLAYARKCLCEITDNPLTRVHPASEEYQKVIEISAEIEELMGII